MWLKPVLLVTGCSAMAGINGTDKPSTAGEYLLEGSLEGQKYRDITVTSHNC
jgi:hypothetical protein